MSWRNKMRPSQEKFPDALPCFVRVVIPNRTTQIRDAKFIAILNNHQSLQNPNVETKMAYFPIQLFAMQSVFPASQSQTLDAAGTNVVDNVHRNVVRKTERPSLTVATVFHQNQPIAHCKKRCSRLGHILKHLNESLYKHVMCLRRCCVQVFRYKHFQVFRE